MTSNFSAWYHKLLQAASGRYADRVWQLLQQPEAASGPDGCSALHAAAEAGDVWVIPILVAVGCDPNARTTDGRTPLLLAVGRRDLDAVAALLGCGASVQEAHSSGDTPLHVAAGLGYAAMVRVLLAAGASPHAANKHGHTPLHMACIGDQRQALLWRAVITPSSSARSTGPCDADRAGAARVLLRAGADVEAKNAKGRTPLQMACRFGHQRLIEELLSRGAQPTAQDNDGWAALHQACCYNQPGVVSRLLELSEVEGQLEMLTAAGETVLVFACWLGHDQVVPLLLAAGADVHALTPCGLRPLQAAVSKQRLSVLAPLLAAGADPCAADHSGQSALRMAAYLGHLDVLQVLLVTLAARQRSSHVDAMGLGRTALHVAVGQGHTSCVQALLAAGADPDKLLGEGATDSNGVSMAGCNPLLWAVCTSHVGAIPLLANPTSLRHVWQGQTPLHQALYKGSAGMAQLLITAGSPAGVADPGGNTAMSLAACSSDPGIRALLPAMVRGECELYKQQLQQDLTLQQQQQREEEGAQQEHSGMPAALESVTGAMCILFGGRAGASEEQPCINMVVDVLGPAAASRLMQQVLERYVAVTSWQLSSRPRAANRCGLQLLRLAHTGWLAAVEPLLHQRQTVTNRLQWLVTQPLQQQQEHAVVAVHGSSSTAQCVVAAVGDQQQVSTERQKFLLCKQLWAEVLAAGDTGQWGLLVQHLEQLAGLQPAECTPALYAVAAQKGWVRRPAVLGLCEALLVAWAAGQQQAARRVVQEVADGVVSALQAWEQQQAVAGVGGSRQRPGRV
jgi:ankyrin repeat protein